MSDPQQPTQIITGVDGRRPRGQTAGQGVALPVGHPPRQATQRSAGRRQPARIPSRRAGRWGIPVLARLAALLLGAGLVAGCSSLRLGYDNLTTLLRWQVDRYVDLDDEQEARVDRRLREIHQWHRETQLPRYVRFLERVRGESAAEITPAVVAGWRREVFSAWEPLADRMAPAVAELGISLRPAQIERLGREMAEENRDREREYFGGRGADAVRAARVKRWQERSEEFLGALNGPQLQVLGERARREPVTAADSDWWSLRLARQQVWMRLMRELATERPPIEEATRRAKVALMTIFDPVDPALRARDEASSRVSDEFVAAILQRMSPAQQRQLDQKLRAYAEDLGRLLAAGARPSPVGRRAPGPTGGPVPGPLATVADRQGESGADRQANQAPVGRNRP